MNNFLQQVALDILSKHSTELDKVQILFPNRRSLLFFQLHLAALAGRPIWTPGMMTLDAWVKQSSDKLIPDELTQLTLLYKSWVNLGNNESFDDFYSLGRILLNDMNQINESLVNRDRLFKDLELLSDNHWEDELAGDSALKALVAALRKRQDSIQITHIWRQMGQLFADYEHRLLSAGMSTESMVYRFIAERISEHPWNEDLPIVYAVGFYQGNGCIQKILNGFRGIHFYWMRIDPAVHQSLDFEFPLEKFRSENAYRSTFIDILQSEKQIQIVAAPGQQLQIQYINRFFAHIQSDQLDKTCITLAEQGLLLPLLQAIPDEIDKVNISMGLSLADTQAYTFTIRYLKLIAAWSKQATIASNYLRSVFKHPLIVDIVPKTVMELLTKRFVRWDELHQIDPVWAGWIKPKQGLELMDQLCQLLEHIYQFPIAEINKAGIYEMYQQLRRLTNIESQLQGLWSATFIEGYVRRILKQGKIMLPGEPLDGLQILGLVESVHLGFQHLLFLDVNEGKMPSAFHETILPHSLCILHELPGVKEKITIQAYLFWASICQAGSVTLLYNSSISGDMKAEPSRWIQRLTMAQHPKNWTVKTHDVVIDTGLSAPVPISFSVKSPIVREQLNAFLEEKRLSASSINNWLDCTLRFYLLHVLGYREPNTKDEWGNHSIGEVVHHVMDSLFKPFQGQTITSNIIASIIKKIPDTVRDKYLQQNELLAYQLEEGSHQLLLKIIEKMVVQIVNIDNLYVDRQKIIEFEKEITYNYPFQDQNIQLLGRLDRIDSIDGKPRIIDFKSGTLKDISIKQNDIQKLWSRKGRKKEVLQTLFYAWLYHQSNPDQPVPEAHLYFYQLGHPKKIKENQTQVLIDKLPISEAILAEFENGFQQVLKEITDDELVFAQTDYRAHCEYCTFKTMCQRD